MCCFNARSVKNKTISIAGYIASNDFDVIALTESETWLGTTSDKRCVGELLPQGYDVKHVPRVVIIARVEVLRSSTSLVNP